MKKIKFRGFDLSCEGWIVGGSLLRKEDVFSKGMLIERGTDYIAIGIQYDDLDLHVVDSKSVGQYIGLQDVNRKEIYEKDILSSFTGRHYEVFYKESEAAFYTRSANPGMTEEVLTADTIAKLSLRIVGNMYENSKLMKSKL